MLAQGWRIPAALRHRSCSSNLCPPWQRGGGKRDFTSPRHCGRGMALGCSSPLLPQRGRLGCTQASWTCFFGGFLGGSWAGFEDVQRKMCLILVIAGRSEVCWVQSLLVWRMQSAAGHGMMAFDYSPVFWRENHLFLQCCQVSGGLRCGCRGYSCPGVPPASGSGCFHRGQGQQRLQVRQKT